MKAILIIFTLFIGWTIICVFIGFQQMTPYNIRVIVANESMSPINATTPDIFEITPYWSSISTTICSYDNYSLYQSCNTTSVPVLVIEGLTWNKSLAELYGERWNPSTLEVNTPDGAIVRCGKDNRNFIGQLGNSKLCNCNSSWIRHRGFKWTPWTDW